MHSSQPRRGKRRNPRPLLSAAAAGMAGAVASTVAQMALWIAFTDDFPAILWRDTRLAAALLMDHAILGGTGPPGWPALGAASLVHFAISLAAGAAICALARPLAAWRAMPAGALCGLALYALDLHGFTLLFPWFSVARGWITLAAHVAFGVAAVAACRALD